jgi:hypothetical protein
MDHCGHLISLITDQFRITSVIEGFRILGLKYGSPVALESLWLTGW